VIVDCHVNVYDDSQMLPLFLEQSRIARPGGFAPKSDPATVIRAMQGVDRAIVFSLRYKDSIGIDGDDDVTARAVAASPDKLIGFAAVDPRRPDAMDLLARGIEELGLKGAKFGPIYNGVSLLDPRMTPVYEYLQRRNLPLTMHMGTTFGQNAPVELGRPLDVDTVARRFPDLKMVMAHMGHPWYEECIVVARKNPNVYCEVSALYYRPWQYYNILIAAQEYTIADRDKIFFGTDFPFTTVEDSIAGLRGINRQLEGTQLPRVSAETIERIIHSNPLEHWWHGGYPGR
jgi:predicted TIM-barrel fold metal-dependent hydrolase